MTRLTWRTLQSKVFILHFNQDFNMSWEETQLMRIDWVCSTEKQRNDELDTFCWHWFSDLDDSWMHRNVPEKRLGSVTVFLCLQPRAAKFLYITLTFAWMEALHTSNKTVIWLWASMQKLLFFLHLWMWNIYEWKGLVWDFNDSWIYLKNSDFSSAFGSHQCWINIWIPRGLMMLFCIPQVLRQHL